MPLGKCCTTFPSQHEKSCLFLWTSANAFTTVEKLLWNPAQASPITLDSEGWQELVRLWGTELICQEPTIVLNWKQLLWNLAVFGDGKCHANLTNRTALLQETWKKYFPGYWDPEDVLVLQFTWTLAHCYLDILSGAVCEEPKQTALCACGWSHSFSQGHQGSLNLSFFWLS